MTSRQHLALYVHFPWCVAKCPYCDFNSHSLRGNLPGSAYLDALIGDLQSAAPAVADRSVDTIFLGGGTPSLFRPAHMQRLLDAVRGCLQLSEAVEITMEANPGALEHADFADYRAAGINRLSLGVQSFSDAKLTALGRIHSAAEARAAFLQARAAGFDNINLDLMYGLPEQTLAEATADLDAALELAPEHLSHYHLTLEPNTVFYARPPALPDDDLSWDMQLAATEKLGAAGYVNYEVSAWAQAGKNCRHNLHYWRYHDYLGIGAGAHGKLTRPTGEIVREIRPPNPRAYMQNPTPAHHTVLPEDACFEFMLNNLRLREGFALADFAGPSALLEPGLREASERGLLSVAGAGRYRPSALGLRFLDDLQAIFLPDKQ